MFAMLCGTVPFKASNMKELHKVSEALILWETLDGEQIDQLISGVDIGLPSISDEPKVEVTQEEDQEEATKADTDPTLSPV